MSSTKKIFQTLTLILLLSILFLSGCAKSKEIGTKELEPAEPEKPEGIEYCEKLWNVATPETDFRDNCYQRNAEFNKNMSVCNKIEIVQYKDNCYARVALLIGNSSLCQNMEGVDRKNRCYYYFAESYKNISFCDKIIDENQDVFGYRNGCYMSIAKETGDSKICKSIDKSWAREECYENFSWRHRIQDLWIDVKSWWREIRGVPPLTG